MSKYFSEDEFKCKCSANNGAGCGMDVSDDVKIMADTIRANADIPLIVNSGARCAKHNAAIGASATSSHTLGLAVDFKCVDSASRFKLLNTMIRLGVKRIGLHKNFIHFDIDIDKTDAIWFY